MKTKTRKELFAEIEELRTRLKVAEETLRSLQGGDKVTMKEIAHLKKTNETFKRLASFPELNPNPVMEVDLAGNVHYLNPAVKQLFPDLQTAVLQHPWLVGLESLYEMLERERKSSHVREVKIGETWYEQTIYPVLEGKRLRIYGLDITARKQAEEAFHENKKDLNRAQAVAHTGSWRLNIRRNELLWSDETHRIFGIIKGTPLTYEAFLATVHPDDRQMVDQSWQAALRGEPYDIEHRILVEGNIKWVRERAELVFDKEGSLQGGFGTVQDITERKQAEEALRKIEWLLIKSSKPGSLPNKLKESYQQPYGNLVEINTTRMLVDLIGEDILTGIVVDFLDLLETSAAVYEKNGDYALGIFASGWCRHLDQASRNLCGTDDNREALKSGKWHCHESCWSEASKVCIETGQPVDIECRGGIRIFAVPIWAGGEIVGSINFGYSDPPKDFKKLKGISEKYGVNMDKLLKLAEAYESRPFFIIDIAKSRLLISAKLIGTIFQHKQAEDALQKAHNELEIRVQERTAELAKAIEELQIEISERKRAQDALRATSLYTRSLIEASLDPLVTISSDGKVMDVNNATELVTGFSREHLIGSDFSDYFTEPEKAREGYLQVFSKGTVRDYPLAIRHTSGRITDVLYNATIYRNEAGEIQGVFAAARDITERKRAEEALRAAHQYNRSLIEASLDPLVTINPEGKVTDVNSATELVTGVSRDQLIGSDFSDYFTEPEKAREGYRTVFLKGAVRDYPLSIRHTSGRITDVLYNATLYRNEVGEVQGVFAAARDITKRKQAQEALKESESRLRYLSSQLLTVQEKERKRVARELHDGIGQLLTAIKFKIEDTLQEKGRGKSESKKRSLETLNQMVKKSIEEVRRIQMDLRPSTLDDLGILATISWFTREFVKIYSNLRIEKRVDLQEDEVPDSLKTIIFRVIQESLNNTAKHSKANWVHLSLQKTDGGIELRIEDNGLGFDLERTLSLKSDERGYGLSSMRERVELSGGSLAIESIKGKGTLIRASWPSDQK